MAPSGTGLIELFNIMKNVQMSYNFLSVITFILGIFKIENRSCTEFLSSCI